MSGGDQLKSCGVQDGSTVQVTSKMRGGGKHKVKRNKAEMKRSASPVKLEQTREEKSEVDPELNEDSQEVRLVDGMCALVCEQMRSIIERACDSEVTKSETGGKVENGEGRCVKERATSEDLHRMERRMEEGL